MKKTKWIIQGPTGSGETRSSDTLEDLLLQMHPWECLRALKTGLGKQVLRVYRSEARDFEILQVCVGQIKEIK